MPPEVPLTLNYVVDDTAPELEDPLLRTDVKKQLSKAAIRINNQRNFLDKKTYNAYVVQVFGTVTPAPAIHGTTLANIFEKITNLFPTNAPTNTPTQCRAIVPDLHDSVIPIPDIIDDPSIITNGPYQKFLNMVPIFYAPFTMPLKVGSIIEVEFNDNNYNEGRIIRAIANTDNTSLAPSFPTPSTPFSGPQPQVGTPLPSPPPGSGPQAARGGIKVTNGPCTVPSVRNSKDPSFNCCPPSTYPSLPIVAPNSTQGITIAQRAESIKRIGDSNGYPRWIQIQAMAISKLEQPNQGPNFNMAGVQLDAGSWPASAMKYVSGQTCIHDADRWRIFATFDSLDSFSLFYLEVMANKARRGKMSEPSSSNFAEGIMDNWLKSWNLSLQPYELALLKTQGYFDRKDSNGNVVRTEKNVPKYRESFKKLYNEILPYF